MSATNDSRMKHGTQSDTGEGAPVDSDELGRCAWT